MGSGDTRRGLSASDHRCAVANNVIVVSNDCKVGERDGFQAPEIVVSVGCGVHGAGSFRLIGLRIAKQRGCKAPVLDELVSLIGQVFGCGPPF